WRQPRPRNRLRQGYGESRRSAIEFRRATAEGGHHGSAGMKEARADVAPVPLGVSRRSSNVVADYIALTKPRLNSLVVVTSAGGYYLGASRSPVLIEMAMAAAGTALVAGGAAVLNQVFERDTDALIMRTRQRLLPDHRVT